ncbi:MAG: DUF1127 domain-containing protein [Pseudomonadota bacterium]
MKGMTHTTATRRPQEGLSSLAEIIGALPLTRWLAVMRERRHLASLDPRLLKDIGIDAEAQKREAARPFWDVTSRR